MKGRGPQPRRVPRPRPLGDARRKDERRAEPACAKARRFDGDVALVTGGSRGIGLEIARGLAEEGARVVLVARVKGRLARAAREVAPAGVPPVRTFAADVGRPDDVSALVAWARRELPRLDVLVNGAALLDARPFEELDERAWLRTLEVNLLGPARILRRLLPLLRRAHAGRVVNVASISGVVGSPKLPGTAAYAASKAGLIALTQVLGAEWAGGPVRVNSVSYGSVDTTMLRKVAPLVGSGMPAAEAARAALFLASRESAPMNGRNLEFWP